MPITPDNWIVNADGDWSTAANWSTGKTPTSNNNVTIATVDVHTITHSGGNDVVNQLTVGNDHFVFSGGALEVLTTASFGDGFTQTGGTLVAGAVTVTGPGVLIGGGSSGATAFSISGAIVLANYVLGGATTLANNGTTSQTGQVTLGDVTGVGATITNAASGTYAISGDFGLGAGAASATLINHGTLKKSAGAGVSVIGVNVTSDKVINAASGILEFNGPTNMLSGTVGGAGQVAFGAGVTTLGASSLTAGALGLYGGATLTLAANASFAHALNDVSNGTTTLNLGTFALSLSSTATAAFVGNFGSALITGSGQFTNSGSVGFGQGVVLGGALRLVNIGLVSQTGQVQAGDGGGGAPTISNRATGTWNISTDTGLSAAGATIVFTNQGLFEKTGGGGVSLIAIDMVSPGQITAAKGVLDFSGSLTATGAVTGAGAIAITGAGVATLGAGASLTVANFQLFNSASLNLGEDLAYAGALNDSSNGTTQINLGGHTLTLSGANNILLGAFGSAVVGGGGTLANSGTIAVGQVVLDGTTVLDNTGTINQVGQLTIGGGGGQAAQVVNEAAGVFAITGADTIGNGASTASNFQNAGHVNVTAGLGVAVVATSFRNLASGVVTVVSGALQNNALLENAGSITGQRLILLGASHTILDAGSHVTTKTLEMYEAATLSLAGSINYAGAFTDASNGSTLIDLGASKLVLNGVSTFSSAFGSDIIGGSGVLDITHASHMDSGTLAVGGTATLEIAATVTSTMTLVVGDGGSAAAAVLIDAAGVYDITGDVGVGKGASALSTVTNNGVFEKTGGAGTSVVAAKFVNNGTITVTSGTLEFLAGQLSNKGVINGAVTTDGSGNVFVTAAAGPAVHAVAQAAAGLTAAAPAGGVDPATAHAVPRHSLALLAHCALA